MGPKRPLFDPFLDPKQRILAPLVVFMGCKFWVGSKGVQKEVFFDLFLTFSSKSMVFPRIAYLQDRKVTFLYENQWISIDFPFYIEKTDP